MVAAFSRIKRLDWSDWWTNGQIACRGEILSRGRVLLLGFADRHSHVILAQKQGRNRHRKPFDSNDKTVSSWIRFHRIRKNLAPNHLAAKMGIASSFIHSWEKGTSLPEALQLASLERIFGCRWSESPDKGNYAP